MCLEEKKRDHHYVFQAYLKKWANSNEKIWCLRDGKPFEVSPRNIAFEKDFYRISSLNDKEIEFIRLFFRKTSDSFKKELENFIKLYTTFDRNEKLFKVLRAMLPIDCSEADEAMEEIDSMLDIARNNILEDTYCLFEGESISWLTSLCNQDTSFFYNGKDDQRERFVNFVCMQYYRTAGIKENTMRVLKEAEEYFVNPQFPKGCIKADNLYLPMLWLISAQCSDVLLKAPLTLLINKSNVPFITSDQPVINTKADYSDLSKEITELVFYYPISPQIAILLNDSVCGDKVELSTDDEVTAYNDLLFKASKKMIFSNIPDILEQYKK